MNAKILSLNVGLPEKMEWHGRSIVSSMKKTPVPGPLIVHRDHIEGDKFANPEFHGTIDSVVYLFGMPSLLEYVKLLGHTEYVPGALGENVTLSELDESEVSVGDVFRIGEVVVQATYPRIPCGKVNIRMEHEEGQKLMQRSGRSGVYCRVMTPGKIHVTDSLERIEKAAVHLPIAEIYKIVVSNQKPSEEQRQRAFANGALSATVLKKWRAL